MLLLVLRRKSQTNEEKICRSSQTNKEKTCRSSQHFFLPVSCRNNCNYRGTIATQGNNCSCLTRLLLQEAEYVKWHKDNYNAIRDGLRDTVLISTVIQVGARFIRVTFIGYARQVFHNQASYSSSQLPALSQEVSHHRARHRCRWQCQTSIEVRGPHGVG